MQSEVGVLGRDVYYKYTFDRNKYPDILIVI